jgi:hypothetical protein
MHRDKTLARILLILSVVHVATAAPEIVRQRSLDVDEDVTPASEKRGNPGDTPQGLYLVPQMDNDRPSTSGAPQLDNNPPSVLGTSQLDNEPPPASGAPHLYNDPPPVSGTPQLDNDPQLASGLGAPHLHNDPPPALGTPQLHDDMLTASGTSSVHDDLSLGPEAFDESYRFNEFRYAPSSHEPETPSLPEPEAPSLPEPVAPSLPESEAMHEPVEAPPTNNLISDAMMRKLISLAGYSVVVGILGGASIYGIHGLIKEQSYVSPFFHPSPADI